MCIEESSVLHKLQVETLVGARASEGKNMPLVNAHSASNTTLLPACFVLKLTKPLPFSVNQARKISKITGIEFSNINEGSNLISLMTKQFFSKPVSQKGISFYSVLPDQNHCYYMNKNSNNIQGILVNKVAFTHPSNVPRILVFLRQQVLFNVVFSSVIRHPKEFGKFVIYLICCLISIIIQMIYGLIFIDSYCHIFEISSIDLNNIYIQFEHPMEQSLVTMDIDLRDITNVKCKFYPNVLPNINLDDYASKIMQKFVTFLIYYKLSFIVIIFSIELYLFLLL